MTDRTIVRYERVTRVLTRTEAGGSRVITRNIGPPGGPGDPGDSAYAVAVANGFVGSEAAWLASLVGDDGPPGVVAAEAPLSYNSLTQTIETDDLVTALAALIPLSQKGAANGVPTLDVTAHIPLSQLPAAVLGALNYQGTWNATSNTPTIPAAASGNKGYYYRVATAGSTTIDGVSDWKVGDWIVSDGTIWQKVDNTDPASVGDVPGLVTALGLKADQTALDSEETDRIAGDDALQAEIDALPTSGSGAVVRYGNTAPAPDLGVEFDSYLNRSTGRLYKKWHKPASWAWTAGGSAQPSLAGDLAALFGLLEGSGGTTKELVSNTDATLVGGASWATIAGLLGVTLDGVDGAITFPTPTILDADDYSIGAVFTLAVDPTTIGAPAIYVEAAADIDRGSTALYLASHENNPGQVLIALERGRNDGVNNDWLYGYFQADPSQVAANVPHYVLAVVEDYETGNVRMWLDGVELEPISPDITNGTYPNWQETGTVNEAANPMTQVRLGSWPYNGGDGDFFPGTIHSVWTTQTAASAEQVADYNGDPFGMERPADVSTESGLWGMEAELATQAELGAEATTRGNADTALDTRVDALELAPPAHVHPESEVTNLVTDLGLKAPLDSPAFINVPTAPTAAPGTNTTQLATMAALQAAITALINGAPGALDTLLEISNQLATDESAVAALITTVAGKQASHANLTAFAALTLIANKLAYANGSGTLALTDYTAFARTWDALADAAAGRSALSLGALAVLATVGAAQIDADAVTTVKILDDNVTNAKLANMATATMKGRKTAGTGDPEDLSASDARTNMGLGSLATVTPTGTPDGTKFLRDDNSWQAASGGGGLTSLEPALFLSGRLI